MAFDKEGKLFYNRKKIAKAMKGIFAAVCVPREKAPRLKALSALAAEEHPGAGICKECPGMPVTASELGFLKPKKGGTASIRPYCLWFLFLFLASYPSEGF